MCVFVCDFSPGRYIFLLKEDIINEPLQILLFPLLLSCNITLFAGSRGRQTGSIKNQPSSGHHTDLQSQNLWRLMSSRSLNTLSYFLLEKMSSKTRKTQQMLWQKKYRPAKHCSPNIIWIHVVRSSMKLPDTFGREKVFCFLPQRKKRKEKNQHIIRPKSALIFSADPLGVCFPGQACEH